MQICINNLKHSALYDMEHFSKTELNITYFSQTLTYIGALEGSRRDESAIV